MKMPEKSGTRGKIENGVSRTVAHRLISGVLCKGGGRMEIAYIVSMTIIALAAILSGRNMKK
jgi:hypothetical protein